MENMKDYNDYYIVLGAIEKRKLDMTKLYLLSCLENASIFTETQIEMMNYCYDIWLNADFDLSLGRLADIVADNWEDIQEDKLLEQWIPERKEYTRLPGISRISSQPMDWNPRSE